VEKNRVLFTYVLEPTKSLVLTEKQSGKEQCSFRTYTVVKRMVHSLYSRAKRIVEDLMRVEAGLRAMALLDAAGNDVARKTALQNTFRRQAKSLATTLTELRLANDLGCEAALQVAAPAVKYDMLTEEQQKVLKELQKDRAVTTKAETANRIRPQPYSGGPQRGVITSNGKSSIVEERL
jgi:hypothetical protein